MNLSQVLLSALKAHGAREVFGIPGDFALPFFREIENAGILPLYTLSHEPGVGFAADASARIRSTLSVAAVTYGAGALNMVNPVAGAYAEKSPVVVISGAPGKGEASTGLLLHHQAKTLDSQFAIYQEITCDQARLTDARTAPAEIARVLASCLRESRPVYIELPRDMVAEPCEPVVALGAPAVDPAALDACTDEILARLAAAERPVLMVGVEVRRFDLEAQVAALARQLGIPVVTSILGRGLLAGHDAPLAGTYLGVAGDEAVTALVEDSDALLMLGVLVSDTNFGVSARQIDLRKAIHACDGEVTLGYHTYAHLPLGQVVRRLLERAPAARQMPTLAPPSYPHGMVADDAPIVPGDIARGINDLMARHGVMPIAADMGDCMFTAMEIAHQALVAPGYYATMGFGVPAGLGLQAATGERPLILVGDGAFQMTGWELGNCCRFGWDPIVLVFNNRSWEMLRTFQPESSFNDLSAWDFAGMAAGLGGDGVRVDTRAELAAALEQAVATRGRFQLIDVTIPRGELSPTLKRFVAGVKRLSAPGAR
ncbi:indolepyruvate/phenylpyruvate decarboxylase [Denitromonas iodatirespirans]|uniref:Indolepyruvate/phenylpyruvate decarboxylase n=1 Tax=Denitromonas iodatirespirans TaxID=2795389 RepID=A0A944D9H1_DENI1|nr:indolepyruvate/phenylpyruvate decarboxylase [Denitromonas iodatirespirans]MBT0962444.1 indolepyruvate/phenylpyruvate decarboxylase [Denitromonas iodatirespirans]